MRDLRKFPVSTTLDVILDDDGKHDPTGILSLRLIDKDGQQLRTTPILPSEVPELIKALVSAAMVLERKGSELTAYDAGYQDCKEGRPPEVVPRWLNDQ